MLVVFYGNNLNFDESIYFLQELPISLEMSRKVMVMNEDSNFVSVSAPTSHDIPWFQAKYLDSRHKNLPAFAGIPAKFVSKLAGISANRKFSIILSSFLQNLLIPFLCQFSTLCPRVTDV